jgi:hypothetical protein
MDDLPRSGTPVVSMQDLTHLAGPEPRRGQSHEKGRERADPDALVNHAQGLLFASQMKRTLENV